MKKINVMYAYVKKNEELADGYAWNNKDYASLEEARKEFLRIADKWFVEKYFWDKYIAKEYIGVQFWIQETECDEDGDYIDDEWLDDKMVSIR